MIIVDSDDYSVSTPINGAQVFVYQKTWHHRLMEKLGITLHAAILSSTHRVVEQQDVLHALHETFEAQLGKTVGELALKKGLPIYLAIIGGSKQVTVTQQS